MTTAFDLIRRANEPKVVAQERAAVLKASLRRVERRGQLTAALLVAPLVLFLVAVFLLPLGFMLIKGVEDKDFGRAFTTTAAALRHWDGRAVPPSETVASFIRELGEQRGKQSLSYVANRLNFDINGMRSMVMVAARRLPSADVADPLAGLVALDLKWGEVETWGAMKRATRPWTDFYLLAALDLNRNAIGEIVSVPEERAVFRTVFARTFWLSLLVTAVCVVLGYPVAYLLATQRPAVANLLMVLVLLPFWTSVLVRTTA